ncbi:DUF4157 domain-containing protein [Moorena sp. SIO3B2]|uniref:eCIS core domain-containing protein n=1 Tax=Moorena sp. SIO3B2 TaxID=2607827 RepID=UPI00257CCA6C|nr:DUF4157 domain-containing protein [Moorena sp. SIO3B2]
MEAEEREWNAEEAVGEWGSMSANVMRTLESGQYVPDTAWYEKGLQAKLRIGLPVDKNQEGAKVGGHMVVQPKRRMVQRAAQPLTGDSVTYGESLRASRSDNQNKTGLPDRLKAGVENLSGYSMDDVRVHYNSSKPAQLQALAYTQGTDIHVAPGQEKHLAHEAWHVVQQKQGRVRPTIEAKGAPVNDNQWLETEADRMGQKAAKNWQGDHRRGSTEKAEKESLTSRVARAGKPNKAGVASIQRTNDGKGRKKGEELAEKETTETQYTIKSKLGESSHHVAYELNETDAWVLLSHKNGEIKNTIEQRKKTLSWFDQELVGKMGDKPVTLTWNNEGEVKKIEGVLIERIHGVEVKNRDIYGGINWEGMFLKDWILSNDKTKIERLLITAKQFLKGNFDIHDFQYWVTNDGSFKLTDVKSVEKAKQGVEIESTKALKNNVSELEFINNNFVAVHEIYTKDSESKLKKVVGDIKKDKDKSESETDNTPNINPQEKIENRDMLPHKDNLEERKELQTEKRVIKEDAIKKREGERVIISLTKLLSSNEEDQLSIKIEAHEIRKNAREAEIGIYGVQRDMIVYAKTWRIKKRKERDNKEVESWWEDSRPVWILYDRNID